MRKREHACLVLRAFRIPFGILAAFALKNTWQVQGIREEDQIYTLVVRSASAISRSCVSSELQALSYCPAQKYDDCAGERATHTIFNDETPTLVKSVHRVEQSKYW